MNIFYETKDVISKIYIIWINTFVSTFILVCRALQMERPRDNIQSIATFACILWQRRET